MLVRSDGISTQYIVAMAATRKKTWPRCKGRAQQETWQLGY